MIMSLATVSGFIVALLFVTTSSSAAYGLTNIGMSPNNNLSTTPFVCKSMDIRNNVSSFHALEKCTVVEGFVQILLLDNVTEGQFRNISFPLLREITGYLLLYRVTALRSVGQLFPNLAVIRGQEKMFEYSLIIYEMANLQDIGLYSLREISAGLVRIDKNPSLCFVRTINWKVIVLESGDHVMKNVKSKDECPLCPGEDGRAIASCVDNPHQCWNREHCQVVCPERCRNSCDSKGNCCDKNCIGCLDDKPNECIVCRNVTYINSCRVGCPSGSYMYLNRRCVTKAECIAMPRPLQLAPNSKTPHEKTHKVLELDGKRDCVLECPPDHTDSNNECVKCEAGRCQKECPGNVIDNVSYGKEFRGCTHINGSLEIQIRGGKNVVSQLEENLKMIEVIDGYLKVVRSFPLISLNFFKKLKVIRGNVLEINKYAVFMLDNQNLQEFWDWSGRTLTIERGRLFFHFNPRLCLDKIRTLQKKTNLPDFTELEVASNSNGDKIACHITQLNVTADTYDKAIALKWDAFVMKDHRKLLGYIVYSIETPHQNVTLFDGRDACGAGGWMVDDVTNLGEGKITHLVTQLKPYTQYAFYVKTDTIASEDSGAQSPIQYIRTKPGKPSMPFALRYVSKNHTILLNWNSPRDPNGIITHYIVEANISQFDLHGLQNRDYCNFTSKPERTFYNPKPRIIDNQTCECTNTEQTKHGNQRSENVIEDDISFEDALYDSIYVKREKSPDHLRKTRQVRDLLSAENNTSSNYYLRQSNSMDINESYNLTDEYKRIFSFRMVVNTTEIRINNLIHFKQYNVIVKACRDPIDSKDNQTCSEGAKEVFKTERRDDVDVITNLEVINVTSDSAIIMWTEPVHPNGYIETYKLFYHTVDDTVSDHKTKCIPGGRSSNAKRSYKLSKLSPGNWSVWMTMTSQAGEGSPTQVIYFYVEPPVKVLPYILGALLVILIVMGVTLYHSHKCIRKDDMKLITSINPDYIPTAYVPDEWEVPREMITLIKELGQGSFGMVYEGIAKDIKGRTEIRCAVKTVNEHATNRERIEFLNEASVMKAFDTSHVVRLLGVVSQGQPTLVIMELMPNGDLKTYLRSHRPDSGVGLDGLERTPPDLQQILHMAIEIADGMSYLSAKKFVHRDVAARNCMVSENLVVKIGDFGMTRDIYETDYYRKGTKGLLPVRWMAPESLQDGVFSSRSDVWSYGVVLWEMATLASQPYQGLTNDQVLRYVRGGNIMERPEQCPDVLYDLMRQCWSHRPSDRPTFIQLCEFLLADARPGFESVSFYHSAAGIEARNVRAYRGDEDEANVPLRENENLFG